MKKLFYVLCTVLILVGGTFSVKAAVEDTQHVSGDGTLKGENIPMTVRSVTAAALAGSNNDYQPLITNANGELYVIQTTPSSGTTFNDVKLIDGTNPRMPDFWGKFAGTSFVNAVGLGTYFSNEIPIAAVTQGVGNKSVSTSGTSLRLASQAARIIKIKANEANSNAVYVVPGGTTSTDYSSTTNPGGYELGPGDSIELPLISNTQEIVIDSTTNAEGINYTWIGY